MISHTSDTFGTPNVTLDDILFTLLILHNLTNIRQIVSRNCFPFKLNGKIQSRCAHVNIEEANKRSSRGGFKLDWKVDVML